MTATLLNSISILILAICTYMVVKLINKQLFKIEDKLKKLEKK